MKKSLYVLLCAAALVSCGQPKEGVSNRRLLLMS